MIGWESVEMELTKRLGQKGIIIRSKEYSRKGGKRRRRRARKRRRDGKESEGGTMMLRVTNGRVTRVWIE